MKYIKGIQNPEDLVQIPHTQWIIASGMAPKSGLYLVDNQTKTAQRWFAPKADQPSALYPESLPQPHPDEMQIHCISLREVSKGKYYLYAVNHNGFDQNITRETIEIFQVLVEKNTPTLTWLGNVPMPKDEKGRYLAGNGVVSGADGSIYVSVMMHPENTLEEMFAEKTTGAIYRWTPQTRQFEKLQGSEFSGNNGIEFSKDGQFIYIVHMRNISKLTNTNPVKVLKTNRLDYDEMDNLHWHKNTLITTGALRETCGEKTTFECLKDYHITTINPKNLKPKLRLKGQ